MLHWNLTSYGIVMKNGWYSIIFIAAGIIAILIIISYLSLAEDTYYHLNLKENNKLLYYILIPLVTIALIIKILADNNIIGAKKDLLDTEKKDSTLKEEMDDLIEKSDDLVEEAKDTIDSIGDTDENWHKE